MLIIAFCLTFVLVLYTEVSTAGFIAMGSTWLATALIVGTIGINPLLGWTLVVLMHLGSIAIDALFIKIVTGEVQ